MLTLAMRTGTVSLELACRILNLPKHAVGRILAEMVVERVDAVVQIETASATFLLLARSPAEIGELTAALLAAYPDARASIFEPIKQEDIH
jgi:hypothetical protein